MSKLITPLGVFRIFDNAVELEYKAVKLDVDPVRFPDINGRFK